MFKRALPLLTRRVTMGFFEWESTLAVTSNQKKRNFKTCASCLYFSRPSVCINGFSGHLFEAEQTDGVRPKYLIPVGARQMI